MLCIDAAQVRTIGNYRRRLDVDAQVAELDDLDWQQPELIALARDDRLRGLKALRELLPAEPAESWMLASGASRAAEQWGREPVHALLRAAQQRDYRAIKGLMTASVGRAFEREIESRIAKVRQALKNGIQIRNGRALLRSGRYKLELIKENGRWRVYDFD